MLGLRLDVSTVDDILSGEAAVLLRTGVAQHGLGVRQGSLRLAVLLDRLELGYDVVQLGVAGSVRI